jgi:hypothetical protein
MTPLVVLPPQAVTPTRGSTPVTVSFTYEAEQTEETARGGYVWPEGIDYSSVSVPKPDSRDGFLDPLDVLELIDD